MLPLSIRESRLRVPADLYTCAEHFPPQLHNNNGPVATRPPSLLARPASDIQASEIAELRAENSNLRSANAEFLDMQDIIIAGIIARLSDIEQGTYYSGGSGTSGGSGSVSGRGTCGYLTPVTYWECPGQGGAVSGSGAGSRWPVNLLPCDQAAFGDLCEGDGECNTQNNLDNCYCANPGNTAHRGCDVYRKSATPPTPAPELPTNRPTEPAPELPTNRPTEGCAAAGHVVVTVSFTTDDCELPGPSFIHLPLPAYVHECPRGRGYE